MKFTFAILYGLKNLERRKLRAVLTIFAVLIGTTLLSSMVSLGVGLQTIVVKNLKTVGELTDINVYKKEDTKALLDGAALNYLENLDGVERVTASVNLMADSASFSGFPQKADKTLVTAVPDDPGDILQLTTGATLNNFSGQVAILGENFLKEFGENYSQEFLGKILNLTFGEKSLSLKIIGIAEDENISSYGVFIPLDQAAVIKNIVAYDSLRVRADSAQKVAGVSKEIKNMGLEAVALDDLIDRVVGYFRLLELALGSVGLIILGVASLGIINTMLMATLERTREIGLMRALGASRLDVLKIFSLEAAGIGLIGGTLGVAAGFLITSGLSAVLNNYLAQKGLASEAVRLFILPWWLICGTIGFATLLGFVSGFYPALRASRMDPVEALRRE